MELAAYTTDFEAAPSPADENIINLIWDQFQEQPVEIAENVIVKLHDNITTKLFSTRKDDKPVWVVENVSQRRYGVWVRDDKSEAVSVYIGCIEAYL